MQRSPKNRNALSSIFLLICLALQFGCGRQALYTSLKEKEANDMLTILLTNDIPCEKIVGIEGTWNIVVDKAKFANAVTILNDVGYPRDSFTSMGEAFKKSGIVSSPLEERVRFIHSLSETLAETLSHISGVVTARVNIVLPDNDPYSEKFIPSSASVFISYLPHFNIDEYVRDIKQLVTNSIEGLSYDKVSVALFPSTTTMERLPAISSAADNSLYSSFLGIKIAKQDIAKLYLIIIAALILTLSALFFVYYFVFIKKNAKRPKDQLDSSKAN